VELLAPKGYGRARMSVIPDASAETLRPFLLATVEPGTTVVTDGWLAYPNACQDWFLHEPHPVAGSGSQGPTNCFRPCTWWPHCVSGGCWAPTRAACSPSTCRPTWTSSASGSTAGTARARGLLFHRLMQYAAGAPPLTYRQMVANPQPKAIKPDGVLGPRSQPGTLALPPQDRPWRTTTDLA